MSSVYADVIVDITNEKLDRTFQYKVPPELTGEILRVIRELAAEHMTMVVVTHEMKFARDVADRVIFMDGGVIVEEGNAEEVFGNTQNERLKAFLARYNEG